MHKLRNSDNQSQSLSTENTQGRTLALHQTNQQINSQTLLATGLVLALDPDFTSTIPLPDTSNNQPIPSSAALPSAGRYQPDLSDANHLLSSQQDHIDFSDKLGKVLSPLSLQLNSLQHTSLQHTSLQHTSLQHEALQYKSLQLTNNISPPPIEALLDEPDHMISDLLSRITPTTDSMFIAHTGQPTSHIMPIDLSTFAPLNSQDLHSLELLNNLNIDEDILG